MDKLAAKDPREAVGGLWDEIGRLQLETLKSKGLTPDHRLLDLGAGSLRGGIHIVEFLDSGHYWATDLSQVLLDEGAGFLKAVGLGERDAHLLMASDFKFAEVSGIKFDFAHAFGVFTDVPGSSIRECFANLGEVMSANGVFLATFALGERRVDDPVSLQFRYPWSFFAGLASEFGWDIELIQGFKHPKGHSLLMAKWSEIRTTVTI